VTRYYGGRRYGGTPRPRSTAADRAAAYAELKRMRDGAAWRHGTGHLDADAYAAELARIDALEADARRRGVL
jgi:hypothetical protein